ncbi:MAG: Crp/Fnr family transcriptional regulator [Bacteroidota bacterium]|nr:Crp/Fnr family transcriptional regulator [Bacteroidota bacterium]
MKKENSRECLNWRNSSPLFSSLSEKEVEFLTEGYIQVHFKKGETIRKQGTILDHVMYIGSGLAKQYIEEPGLNDIILTIIIPGKMVCSAGFFVNGLQYSTVAALTDTEISFFKSDHLKDLLHQNKDFFNVFMGEFTQTVLNHYQRLSLINRKQVPGRMADSLLYLSKEIYNCDEFSLDLNRLDLANLCGMSKDSVDKVLRDFQEEKLIQIKKNIFKILDEKALRNISKFG